MLTTIKIFFCSPYTPFEFPVGPVSLFYNSLLLSPFLTHNLEDARLFFVPFSPHHTLSMAREVSSESSALTFTIEPKPRRRSFPRLACLPELTTHPTGIFSSSRRIPSKFLFSPSSPANISSRTRTSISSSLPPSSGSPLDLFHEGFDFRLLAMGQEDGAEFSHGVEIGF